MWGYIIFLTFSVYYPPMPCHILMMPDMADPGAVAREKPSLLVAKQLRKGCESASGPSQVQHVKFTQHFVHVMVLIVNSTESIITRKVSFWACLLGVCVCVILIMSICVGRPVLIVGGAIS